MNQNTHTEVWLTPKQLAARLHVTTGRLASWRMVGRGPSVTKLTPSKKARVLYAVKDVLAWEASLHREVMNTDQNAVEAYQNL